MPVYTLAAIAQIRTGYTFREALTAQINGSLHVVQIKDLHNDQRIRTTELIKIDRGLISETQWLQANDIVVAAKGLRNNCAIFDGSEAVVAASQLLVISLNTANVLPHYLLWYLTHAEQAQKFLADHKTGSHILTLSKKTLLEMPIVVPSIEHQQRIVAMQQLAHDEQRLYQDLQRTRQQQLRAVFRQLLENAT